MRRRTRVARFVPSSSSSVVQPLERTWKKPMGPRRRLWRKLLPTNIDGSRERIAAIETATDRAEELTRHLLTFSNSRTTAPEPLSVNESVRRSTPLLKQLIGPSVALSVRLDSALRAIRADSG